MKILTINYELMLRLQALTKRKDLEAARPTWRF